MALMSDPAADSPLNCDAGACARLVFFGGGWGWSWVGGWGLVVGRKGVDGRMEGMKHHAKLNQDNRGRKDH